MLGALFKDTTLADGKLCHIVEGNYQILLGAAVNRFLRARDTHMLEVCEVRAVTNAHR